MYMIYDIFYPDKGLLFLIFFPLISQSNLKYFVPELVPLHH